MGLFFQTEVAAWRLSPNHDPSERVVLANITLADGTQLTGEDLDPVSELLQAHREAVQAGVAEFCVRCIMSDG